MINLFSEELNELETKLQIALAGRDVGGQGDQYQATLLAMQARLSSLKWQELANWDEIRLELGAGRKRGQNGWITVDLDGEGADVGCDLTQGIPLPDGVVDMIYCSHLLEHIPQTDLIPFLQECWRVLKSGGGFSVCVPDASLYIASYARGEEFEPHQPRFKPAQTPTGSPLDQINYVAYMAGHHKVLLDQELLIRLLVKAGFTDVQPREFDPALDIVGRDYESTYAMARK